MPVLSRGLLALKVLACLMLMGVPSPPNMAMLLRFVYSFFHSPLYHQRTSSPFVTPVRTFFFSVLRTHTDIYNSGRSIITAASHLAPTCRTCLRL